MPNTLIDLVDKHDYQTLFLEHLRWSRPDQPPLKVQLDNAASYSVSNVSSYKGLRVWVCPEFPSSSDQAAIDRSIAKKSTDRLVIFHNDTKQVWRWPVRTVRAGSINTRLTSHLHTDGKDNPKLLKRLEAITLGVTESLSATDVIERVKRAFDVETERETKRASKLMASMFDALSQAGTSEHDISVTLARVLFLMFGDDTDMWDKDLFQNFIINHTRPDGTDLATQLNELFDYLDTKPEDRGSPEPRFVGFKYVNGGIFQERITLPQVGKELRETILEATTTDWSEISPAIFGSMFQSVRDPLTRRQFGEHYTSEKDILRTLNPLFLDELRGEFEQALDHREEYSRLTKLRARLGRITFLDPACGCGNFIIVAYRELRLLEISILERIRLKEAARTVTLAPNQLEFGLVGELDAEGISATTLLDPAVTLDNFYGIEIDEWPAKIAETAMFLIDRQCDLQMLGRLGYAPDRLPIARQATIVTATAEDPQRGNALRQDWSRIFDATDDTIVAGNPPYIGGRLKSDEQAADLQRVWGDDFAGTLDYVTGWHAQALKFLDKATKARFAFVTTNSIVQGAMVPDLFAPIKNKGWKIRFAHRTFPWESEAAGKAVVHCVIVGFDRGSFQPLLWDYKDDQASALPTRVPLINAYLVDAPEVLVRARRRPLSSSLPPVDFGSMPNDGGALLLDQAGMLAATQDPIAAKYIRPFVGSRELIHGTDRWCLWLINASEDDLRNSPFLRHRTTTVRNTRQASKRKSTAELADKPHLFGEIRQPNVSYVCIPRHFSEDRQYATVQRFEPSVICGDANFTAKDDDGFLFALISSSMFLTWQRMVGGRIKSDYRFSNTIVWNNFPLGSSSPETRKTLCEAGQAVLAARANHPGASLEKLYGPATMPEDLMAVHRLLDAEVDRFFSVPPGSEELDRQRLLLKRYAKYAK